MKMRSTCMETKEKVMITETIENEVILFFNRGALILLGFVLCFFVVLFISFNEKSGNASLIK